MQTSDVSSGSHQSQQLVVGTVIRSFVTDTTPPKYKYWIIVGVTAEEVELATVYINTRPNDFILRNPTLSEAQFPITADSRRLVEYNCYANCSELKRKGAADIQQLIDEHPEYVRGELYPEEIDHMLKLVRESPNISNRDKRRFGII